MKLSKNLSSLLWLLPSIGAATGASAALADQKLLPAQSEIVFVSKQMGVPVEGRFKKFDAQISFDPAKPEASKMAFTVDTGSASLGAPETDVELPKAPWFNVPKFPQATFQSSAVKGLGGGKFEVSGKLSIKGNVRDVVVPVALAQSGATTTATGAFAIKRLAFKIGENEWADTSMVADDVQVKFKLALTGVGKL
ncbi:MAG: YceI family protein [Rhodoferax sp.]|nr:YceI family protein [Rhodoferax sp.]MDP3654726.1 YceI family protein [Rhodoferax sp.]